MRVGTVRTGNSIPVSGWPNGAGYTHYKWRLDSGAWSAETPTANPISLSSLANGLHHVEVTGKRDSGWYQDAPDFGIDSLVTTGRTWKVDTSYIPPSKPAIRLNEILAQNSTTLTNGGSTPDLIELYNYGTSNIDLSGMGITDSAGSPYKYTFPAGFSALAIPRSFCRQPKWLRFTGFSSQPARRDVYSPTKLSMGRYWRFDNVQRPGCRYAHRSRHLMAPGYSATHLWHQQHWLAWRPARLENQ